MIVAFSVAPAVADNPEAELSGAVAEAVRVVRESGLPNETNAMFTLIEGEWDEVMDVIKRATQAVEAVSPRVSLVIKADIRRGYTDMLHQKVESLNKHFEAEENNG
ncbi:MULTISPECIES: thiamine-binding protein [unclassified Corynebacterium]|uniref:thiamine-binding protein n=1 Tax=unclassified Corynebacterium TaxID=2624378 RepID=UPI002A9187A6|nr:thiamine-binding protein [Corynebacterium sp.]MDY5785846.1 thiamine-binding protein [Corynebacterium sp.]